MNLSGQAVGPLMEKHQIGISDLVAVFDELNLPWGSLRIRPGGSAGGHNGVRSLIGSLGTQEFCRVRLGVHPGRPVNDGAEYLLAPVRRSLEKEMEEMAGYAAEAVESIIAEGVEKSMTKFNRRAQGLQNEDT
jgi:PTH1 family peptidyl-tRNA hydrolase